MEGLGNDESAVTEKMGEAVGALVGIIGLLGLGAGGGLRKSG